MRDSCAIPIGDEVFVVDRKQLHGLTPACRMWRDISCPPVRLVVDDCSMRTNHFQCTLRVSREKTRPPDEVPDRRRSMTLEVPAGQFRKRFITIESP
jgi:hypothetical protein